ncbi:class III signal peptide-containing protein [Candidatus Micrarchaeota archaeon]|nr:class III signal peptide-containing protein [Candidatus Micrarchaeota archaeon]
MRKGQASLEYLIIIGAVIAVAAVVILFISNISGTGGKQTALASCRTAGAQCAQAQATYGAAFKCDDICSKGCIDPATGMDVLKSDENKAQACDINNPASGCGFCLRADVASIRPA